MPHAARHGVPRGRRDCSAAGRMPGLHILAHRDGARPRRPDHGEDCRGAAVRAEGRFIAVAIIGGLTLLGGNLDAMLNGIAAKFVAPT